MADRNRPLPRLGTLFRPEFWATPERTLWTPCIAGMVAHLLEMLPGFLDEPGSEETKVAIVALDSLKPPDVLSEKMRRWICGIVRYHIPNLSQLMPGEIALDELGVGEDDSLAMRLACAERWVERTPAPLPWVALILSTQLTMGKDGCDHFMRAERPFGRLSKGFRALALQQSLGTWEAAVCASREFWRDTRGDFASWLMLLADSRRSSEAKERQERQEQQKTLQTPEHNQLINLQRRLERSKAEAAAMTKQMAQLQREQGELRREMLEARQSRDRAVARLRALTAGDRREATGDIGQGGQDGPNAVPAVREANARRGEAAPAASAASPRQLAQRALCGRRVYLFTGQERAATRREMGKALEQYGAICEVYDGNRRGNLGPERFDPEALVVIETGHLSHSSSEMILERARASGAWFYVGPAGSGGLARKVAERWWRTRGEKRAG